MLSDSPPRGGRAAPYDGTDPVRAVALTGALLALMATAGALTAHLIGAWVFDSRFAIIDAELEANAPTWASSAAAAVAAAAAAVLAVVAPRRRLTGIVIAAALTFLSLDEAVQIHERLGDEIGRELLGASEDLASSLQLAFLLPVLFVLFVLVARLAWREWPRRREASALLAGGLVALAVSLGIEQVLGRITNALEEGGTDWPDVIRIGLEEATELGGWLLLAAGLLVLVCDQLRRSGSDVPRS